MDEPIVDSAHDQAVDAEVSSGLDEAKALTRSFSIDDVRSGQWFLLLLQKVIQAYDRNATAEHFQQKYPGLDPDEIADTLISVTIRYAAIAGAITGVATTADIAGILASAGMTAALMIGSIGTEMLYLARIQMRLVLDLSVVYDLQLDPEDPEDVLMVFGYAMGVAPSEMLGKGVEVAAGASAKYAIKRYISKDVLKALQDFARRIGFKILQRTIIKYTVPVASAIVGSSYNYVSTKSLGKIAKSHLENRGKVTDELRLLVSRQTTYDLAFPAAAMYMAQVDGRYTAKEKEFYRALLSRMSFDKHTRAEFQKLVASEENILDAIAGIDDVGMRSSLVEVLALMAVYDGELTVEEREFLASVALHLDVPIDLDQMQQRAGDYRVVVQKSAFQKGVMATRGVASRAVAVTGQTVDSMKSTALTAGSSVRDSFAKRLGRRILEESPAIEIPMITCTSCGNDVPAEYKFCPNCGQSMVTDKNCVSCHEVIAATYSFCPHCGAPQA